MRASTPQAPRAPARTAGIGTRSDWSSPEIGAGSHRTGWLSCTHTTHTMACAGRGATRISFRQRGHRARTSSSSFGSKAMGSHRRKETAPGEGGHPRPQCAGRTFFNSSVSQLVKSPLGLGGRNIRTGAGFHLNPCAAKVLKFRYVSPGRSTQFCSRLNQARPAAFQSGYQRSSRTHASICASTPSRRASSMSGASN